MAQYPLNHREHIPPHRVWEFLSGESDVNVSEKAHLEKCEECRSVLRVCLEAKTFGEALKSMGWKESA
jgi:hypothetical protein